MAFDSRATIAQICGARRLDGRSALRRAERKVRAPRRYGAG